MKRNYKSLALLTISLGLLWSCKKSADSPSADALGTKQINNVSLEGDYLKFKDYKSFDSVATVVMSRQGNDLEGWYQQFPDFISYKSTYDKINDEYVNVNSNESFAAFRDKYRDLVTVKSDSSLTYKFGTPFSAFFTNNKGELKIGDMFYVYTKDNRVISYAGARKSESELAAINETDSVNRIFVAGNKANNVSSVQSRSIAVANNYPDRIGEVHRERKYTSDRELIVQLIHDEVNDQGTMKSRYYFAVTQNSKSLFGKWSPNKTDLTFMNITAAMYYMVGPVPNTNLPFSLPYYRQNDFKGTFIVHMGLVPKLSYGIGTRGDFQSRGTPEIIHLEINKRYDSGWRDVN